MAPLAPKPPFATDKPDSFYEQPQSQPRLRQPPPPDPNQRTSAYNLYDNYLGDDNTTTTTTTTSNQPQPPNPVRNSGVGDLGMELLNMEDSDSEDEDNNVQPKRNSPPGLVSSSPSKHAVLAATLSPTTRLNFPPVPAQLPQPQKLPASLVPSSQPSSATVQAPSQVVVHQPLPPSLQSAPNHHHVPQPIAAPRPGYAAPIAALNLARAEPIATPAGRMPNPNSTLPHINNPYPQQRSQHAMRTSPSPSTPHPLHPSVTPITPAFIRPSKSPALRNEVNVKFSEGVAVPRKPIIRGNSEETLLPGRGEKGDDFWRRFSMVAKEGGERKESSWLHKMRSGSNRQSRMVWLTGIFIILLIAGGVVLGLFLTRKAPSNQQPVALGGSADATSVSGGASSVGGATSKSAAHSSQTSFHVTPTFTLKNREPDASPLVVHVAEIHAAGVVVAAARRLH